MYEFMYDVEDLAAGLSFGHMEKRDGLQTVGQYNVLLPDGRKQVRPHIIESNNCSLHHENLHILSLVHINHITQ